MIYLFIQILEVSVSVLSEIVKLIEILIKCDTEINVHLVMIIVKLVYSGNLQK